MEICACKQCKVNKVTGQEKENDCRMNWGGSSKAMESDLAADMSVSGTTEMASLSTIIMDEDLTQKSVGNNLYVLQKNYHIFSSKEFLSSKMFLISNQPAQAWSSTHKSKYSKYSFALLWRPHKM